MVIERGIYSKANIDVGKGGIRPLKMYYSHLIAQVARR